MNFSSLDLKRLAKRESAGNTTLFWEELEINRTSEKWTLSGSKIVFFWLTLLPEVLQLEISTKEDAILIILKELDASHEKVIRMYFGLGTDPKSSIEEIGKDLDLATDAVIELKNEGIREFIKLIVSTGIFGDKDKNFTDNFVQSSDSEFLDDFMKKFIGSN